MSQQIVNLTCPGCGAGISTQQRVCEYCRHPVVITTFNAVSAMSMPEVNKCAGIYRKALAECPDHQALNASVAMCWLKLKLYDPAIAAFEKAMVDNFDDAEVFFYAAVCLLKGQKAFVASRAAIDRAVEYVRAALMIEERGIFHYFLAYLRYDYFHRKFLNTTPDYQTTLQTALEAGVSVNDAQQLFALLGVEQPGELAF